MRDKRFSLHTKAEVFYGVCTAVVALLRFHLNRFAAYKPFYDPAYIDDFEQAANNAKNLPNPKTTRAQRKQLRIHLIAAAKVLRDMAIDLKGYIKKSVPKQSFKAQLEQAGWAYFKKGGRDWNAIKSMTDMVNAYLRDNATKLRENNNMPAGFVTAFTTVATTFTNTARAYALAEQTDNKAVEDKDAANASVYETLMDILTDGQIIFKNDKKKKKWFTYAYQVSLLTGGAASFKGHIMVDGKPAAGVTVTSEGKSELSDSNGYFKFSRTHHGDRVFYFEKPGLITEQVSITLEPGVAKTVHVEMTAPAQEEAA